jgi:hypothetical protein
MIPIVLWGIVWTSFRGVIFKQGDKLEPGDIHQTPIREFQPGNHGKGEKGKGHEGFRQGTTHGGCGFFKMFQAPDDPLQGPRAHESPEFQGETG